VEQEGAEAGDRVFWRRLRHANEEEEEDVQELSMQ